MSRRYHHNSRGGGGGGGGAGRGGRPASGGGGGDLYKQLIDSDDLVRELDDIEAISQQVSFPRNFCR